MSVRRRQIPNPPPKEDTWVSQTIGSPFPPSPVKCMDEQNMYVAMWHEHGRPIHGRAWNNGGVVECSFPDEDNDAELTTKAQLGQIQVLQYLGDHNSQGFWYEWIKYKDRSEKLDDKHQLVRYGCSFPIFWKRAEGNLLGYVDTWSDEEARFSIDGKILLMKASQLNEMYIITRNCVGGPPHCPCAVCGAAPPPPKPVPRVERDEWMDIREGDPWPTRPLVKALDKTLNTLSGENPDQYVALWYMQGEPVMGRAFKKGGKVAANFSWSNNEYCKNVGSIQLLIYLPDSVRGFDYGWIPFRDAAKEGNKQWHPVHVNNHKGDISVGVANLPGGKQILAKVDIRNEKYGYGFQGKERFVNRTNTTYTTIVLCRRSFKSPKKQWNDVGKVKLQRKRHVPRPSSRISAGEVASKRRKLQNDEEEEDLIEVAREQRGIEDDVGVESEESSSGPDTIKESLSDRSFDSDYLDEPSRYQNIPLSPIPEVQEPAPSPEAAKDNFNEEITQGSVQLGKKTNVTGSRHENDGKSIGPEAPSAVMSILTKNEQLLINGAEVLMRIGRMPAESNQYNNPMEQRSSTRMYTAFEIPSGTEQQWICDGLKSLGIDLSPEDVFISHTFPMVTKGSYNRVVFFALPGVRSRLLYDQIGETQCVPAKFNASFIPPKRIRFILGACRINATRNVIMEIASNPSLKILPGGAAEVQFDSNAIQYKIGGKSKMLLYGDLLADQQKLDKVLAKFNQDAKKFFVRMCGHP